VSAIVEIWTDVDSSVGSLLPTRLVQTTVMP
jgi:hypothetical protein